MAEAVKPERQLNLRIESEEGSTFCTAANLSTSIIYLSQELQNLGFPYKLIERNGDKLNLVGLVNSCWEVVQLYHSAVQDGNTLFDQKRRDAADRTHLQKSVTDLQSALEEKDKQAMELIEKERQASSMNKALASKLKTEKDEIRRLRSILHQKDAHHQHEIRKIEMEKNKLKERLHRLVTGDRGSEARPTMNLRGSSLNKPDTAARSRWNTDNANLRNEEELHQRVFGQYESWVSQLSVEGDQLKDCLRTVLIKLSSMAKKFPHSKLNSAVDERGFIKGSPIPSSQPPDNVIDDIFSLNFQALREEITKQFDDTLHIIEINLDKDMKLPSIKDPDGSSECVAAFISEGNFVEQKAELEQEYQNLKEDRKKLRQEREVFAAAAIKLNREKALFEAEKVELLRNQFLDELPSFHTEDNNAPFMPNTSFESSSSSCNLFRNSANKTAAVPNLTSPTGNITAVGHPVTIGPTRILRNNSNKCVTPIHTASHTPTRKSAPASRNSSLTRKSCQLPQGLSRTLDRPSRSRGTRKSTNDRGSSTVADSQESFFEPCSIRAEVSLPGFSQSMKDNHQFIAPRRSVANDCRVSDGTSSSLTELHPDIEDCFSYDSGFCHEGEENKDLDNQHVSNILTSSRLDALENSLGIILERIDKRNKEDFAKKIQNKSDNTEKSRVSSNSGRRAPDKVVLQAPRTSSRQSSMSDSLPSNYKSSENISSNEPFFKKIFQTNLSRFSWK